MNLFEPVLQETQRLAYLSVTRILACSQTENEASLVGNRHFQPFLWGEPIPRVTIQPGGWLLADFGTEFTGGVRFLSVQSGHVRVRFGESAGEAMNPPEDEHTVHEDTVALPAWGAADFGSTALRFAFIESLESEKTLEFQNILGKAHYADLEQVGAFHSSDERLDEIWQMGAYTVLLNMQELVYDGAKRDRLPWMGDLNPEMRTVFRVFQDTALVRKTLDYLKNQIPHTRWMHGMPAYSAWFVISQWEYYWQTGDLAYLAQQREYIYGLLARYAALIDANGVEQLPHERFLDWADRDNPEGVHAGFQALLYWTFRSGAAIAGALGDDSAPFATVQRRLARHIPDTSSSKSAAALACVSGLADKSADLAKGLPHGMSCYFGCYMLEALPTGTALDVIRRFWGGMIDFGATTFWEEFDLDWTHNALPITELPQPGKVDIHGDTGKYCYKGYRKSLCHGWASGPTFFLSSRLPGIKFLEPGGRRIRVTPDIGELEFMDCTIPTVYGPVRVTCEKGKTVKLDVPKAIQVDL